MKQVIAGTARLDITPDWPVMLAGFGQRTSASIGIHDRIFAKALYLSSGDDRLLIITTDLLCIPAALARAVVARLAPLTGLVAQQICVCASHTHSAPLPVDAGDGAIGIARYAPFLQNALADVGAAAIACARPSRLRSGAGEVDLFLNRRTRGNPNIVDARVPVLAVDDSATGAPVAVLFGVGCHPVTMGWDNMQISADFPGCAQRAIEAALPGVNALFFNTTEGNVIPRTSPNLDALDPRGYCGGGFENSVRIGEAIAGEVLRARDASPPREALSLHSQRSELQIMPNTGGLDAVAAANRLAEARATLREFLGNDFEASVAPAQLWSVASRHVIERELTEPEMRRLMVGCCLYLGLSQRAKRGVAPKPVEVPFMVIRINDLELLALPGEVLVEVGQEWSRRTASRSAFVVGLANAHLRYLPLAAHFAEPLSDLRYETVTAGLEPNGIERVLDAAMQMRAAR
jgi:hypothetical protein